MPLFVRRGLPSISRVCPYYTTCPARVGYGIRSLERFGHNGLIESAGRGRRHCLARTHAAVRRRRVTAGRTAGSVVLLAVGQLDQQRPGAEIEVEVEVQPPGCAGALGRFVDGRPSNLWCPDPYGSDAC